MEITVDRDEFFKTVARAQSIIEKRSNMPILSMVLLSSVDSHIHISATDLEISFQERLPAEVKETGSITVPGRKLFEILKESKGPKVYIKEKENHWVFISDDEARYNLACLPAEEYPIFVEPEDVLTVSMDGELLREMINKTIYSVTMEEAGFKLSGIFTQKVAQKGKTLLRMVSTDGHRLSLIEKEMKDIGALEIEGGVMIPKKGMSELQKFASDGGPVQIGFKQNNCVVKKDNCVLVVRLLESKFPDYDAVIPKKAKVHVLIKKEILLNGMRKMVILSNESYRGVKISLMENNMELVSINPDLGDAQENLAVEYTDEAMEAGFNARYFIDVLQAMDSEVVDLGFVDNSSPCLITGEGDQGFLALVMPMRL